MNDPFETVDGGDLALAAFVGASRYDDFIFFADRNRFDLG